MTLLAFFALAWHFGESINASLFIGCLAAVSSTVIVMKLLQERDETRTPHGGTALAILIFQDIAIVPMILITPLLAGHAGDVSSALPLPLPRCLVSGLKFIAATEDTEQTNHVIIIGFGFNGRNVAKAARVADIPYVIVEMNPEIVETERAKGEPIFYGDAIHDAVLEHANIKAARVVVVVISDAAASRRIVATAHGLNPTAHMIARTRYLAEVEPLYRVGANEVIPEEFETSVEIFTRVLMEYLIPDDQIKQFVSEVWANGYQMFRQDPTL